VGYKVVLPARFATAALKRGGMAGFPVASGSNAYSVTVDPSNQFLYVGNGGSANISGYKLDTANGGLSAIPGSPFAAGSEPDFIAIL
jgi:streptogramin lyase